MRLGSFATTYMLWHGLSTNADNMNGPNLTQSTQPKASDTYGKGGDININNNGVMPHYP